MTAAIVVGVLLAQWIVLTSYGYMFTFGQIGATNDLNNDVVPLTQALGVSLLRTVAWYIVFGVGVFLSLRFVAPIVASDGWRRVILRGVVATAIGAAVLLLFGIVWSVLASLSAGSYPFGYSFNPSINVNNAGAGVVGTFATALNPLINWFPIVVLAGILQKVWLQRPAARASSPAPASGAAKP